MADANIIEWGLCMACTQRHRWVRTLAGVGVPVSVTTEPGGALVPVIAGDGARRVDLRRPAHGDRPGFVPHWQVCTDPAAWAAERSELAASVPTRARALNPRSASHLGRCAGCYRPDHTAYGPGAGGTLCAGCSQILAGWRATPARERPPLQYPRWKGTER